MRNITLSVPDDIYREARIAAARNDTSISAVAAESLRAFARGELAKGEDPKQVRLRLFEKAFSVTANQQGLMPKREDLYDRPVLS